MQPSEAWAIVKALQGIEEVRLVRLQPGDVIVCRAEERFSLDGAERVREGLMKVFPGHEVLITQGCSIEVARPEQFDGHVPCKWCNDEGIVHTHDGQVIGPCECVLNDGSRRATTDGFDK